MPPRPFLLPFSIGVDICSSRRIETICAVTELHRPGPRFVRFINRILTWREREYMGKRFRLGTGDSFVADKSRLLTFVSGRWAAKEACIKAVKPRRVFMQDIEIWPQPHQHGNVVAFILDEQIPAPQGWTDKMWRANLVAEGKRGPSEPPDHFNVEAQLAKVSISHESIGGAFAAVAVAMAVPSPELSPRS